MRYIVYGLGAIGGTVAGRLALAGADVAGVARGDHLDRIRADGLRLFGPDESAVVRFPVTDDPAELRPGGDDVVILAVKSQDTGAALRALAAASREPAVACFQNGVANERAAARYFERVCGAVVMCPATHLEPGVVAFHSSRVTALFDIGRYPGGTDAVSEGLVSVLTSARFDARLVDDVMRWKYRKLLMNLGNAAQALTGADARAGRLAGFARREGEDSCAPPGSRSPRPRRTGPVAGTSSTTSGPPALRSTSGARPGRAWREGRVRWRSTGSTARSSCSAGWPGSRHRSTPNCNSGRPGSPPPGRSPDRAVRKTSWRRSSPRLAPCAS